MKENWTISELLAIVPFKSIKHASPGMLPENGFQKCLSDRINPADFTWELGTELLLSHRLSHSHLCGKNVEAIWGW